MTSTFTPLIFAPSRNRMLAGRYALVDGIGFTMPVGVRASPALMTAFAVDAVAAAALLPDEIHPLRLPDGRAVLVLTVVDYRDTDIGEYVEFSIAIACSRGWRPLPRMLSGLALVPPFGPGQYVLDLPVSSLISVKGGKGIWGMPKHQANLDFVVTDAEVSSQYDLAGQLVVRVEIDRPGGPRIPFRGVGVNYCSFRGMLMKSRVRFSSPARIAMFGQAGARLYLGDSPRADALHSLGISGRPLFTAFFENSRGVLYDHTETWFLTSAAVTEVEAAASVSDSLAAVVDLEPSRAWLDPPSAPFGPVQLVP